MKKQSFLLIFSSLFFYQLTLSQNFHFAQTFGSKFEEHCSNVALDKYGNTYVAGNFGYLFFYWRYDSTMVTTPYLFIDGDTLSNKGVNNLFLVKYDNSGDLVWAKSIGGNNYWGNLEYAGGLTCDTVNDCIYLAGDGTGLIPLGSDTLICTYSDAFLIKFDLNGNSIWSRSFHGVGYDAVNDICLDGSGNVYITGGNEAMMSIQSIVVEKGGYIAKFDPAGNCIWAKREFIPVTSNNNGVTPFSISVSDSDIVIGGCTGDHQLMIDSVTFTDPNYTPGGNYYLSGILAKFDISGHVSWAKFLGSPYTIVTAVDHDNAGNIYTGGWFFRQCYFDSLVFNGSNIDGSMFVAKHTPSGNITWIDTAGLAGYAQTSHLMVDKSGNCYVAGGFDGPVRFGPAILTGFGAFIAKYLPDGNAQWARQIGNSHGKAIAIPNDGSVVAVGGEFYGSITFGSDPAIPSYGESDIFVAKYDLTSGIENKTNSFDKSLNIYANPSSGNFNITVPDDLIHEYSILLIVYSQLGNIVYQKRIEIAGDKRQPCQCS